MDELTRLLIQTLGEEQYRAITEGVKKHLESADYKRAVDERMALMEREAQVLEEAPWIGRTGLPEDLERELPRYLRRELGESLFDEGSLKAADLHYLGCAPEEGLVVHYWRLEHPNACAGPSHAYIEVSPDGGSCTGWGDRDPPAGLGACQT